MTSFTRQYSFPNVSVRETVRGPQEFISVWRNTIGIAAPFNKGPLLSRITSRKEFVNLYGEDNSPGSIAVRQAMLQGATNFVISRALPSAKGAYGSISFTNPAGALSFEPVIGSNDNRTVGLVTELGYISDVRVLGSSSIAYSLNSNNQFRESRPEIISPNIVPFEFRGLGSFTLVKRTTLNENLYDYFLRTTEDPTTVTTSNLVATGFSSISSSNLAVTSGEQIVKVVFPKNGLPTYIDPTSGSVVPKTRYVDAFMPGMRIDGGTNGPVFDSPGTIVSELVNEDDLNYSFYLKANITAAGTDTSFRLLLPTGTEEFPVLDVFRIFFRPNTNESLPGNVKFFGNSDDSLINIALPIGYLTINRHDDCGVPKPIIFYERNDINSLTLSEVNTQISYKVGTTLDNYIHVVEDEQTINFAKSVVNLGETDQAIVNINPNTNNSFTPGQSVASILRELQAALSSDPVILALNAEVDVNLSSLPYSLTVKLGFEGLLGNKVNYKVTKISKNNTSTDIDFSDNGSPLFGETIYFIGGVNEVVPASKFFYNRQGAKVLYIEAISPGLSGNNIRVNIKPIDDVSFILEVRELSSANSSSSPNESFYLSNTTVDIQTGVYPETLDSNLIRAYYVPLINALGLGATSIDYNQIPVRVEPADNEGKLLDVNFPTHPSHIGAAYLQNVALVGGSEPNFSDIFISEEAYIDAIDRLEQEDVAFITAPGLIAGDVRFERAINSLIQQADKATPYNGLRIAVVSVPPKLTKSRAEILNSTYNSPNLVLVGGWSGLSTAQSVGLRRYSPEGYYVGLVSVSDTYISPASSYFNNFILGANNIDTDSRLDSLDAYTNNNIEMLYLDKVSGKVKFLNGRTSAQNLEDRWVAVRRQSHHLIMNITKNLAWARSAPNDSETRQRVASAADALMKTELRRGAISDARPTSINLSDPTRLSRGYLDIVLSWTPVFPADYISVELVRAINSTVSIQTQIS